MKKLFCLLLFLFPVVVFAQQPWYKYSPTDDMWLNVGNVDFSAGKVRCSNLSLNSSGIPYVAYQDEADSNKATVMQFDGTSWVNVGNAGFSQGEADEVSLAISPTDGEPYVAYSDGYNLSQATLMKFNGTSWVNVGNADFTGMFANNISLAFSPSGQPYVAYDDYGDGATVMKFDGTSWVDVGNVHFSVGALDCLSLAFNPADSLPYVAYQDFGTSQKATVMKLNGTSWVNVGNAGFSAGAAPYISFAFSPSGQPYVAYEDAANSGKATVMMFNGTNWVAVGNVGFSMVKAAYTSLAFSPSDSLPYIAFEDYNNDEKASVMKFMGNNWVYVGEDFSAGPTYNEHLAISSVGEPYIAYRDSLYMLTVMRYDSGSVGINKLQQSKFSLYPNPATDKVRIEIAEGQIPSQLSIMNLNGQAVLTCQMINPKTQIDISNLPVGIYFLRLTNDKMMEVGKFVKQ